MEEGKIQQRIDGKHSELCRLLGRCGKITAASLECIGRCPFGNGVEGSTCTFSQAFQARQERSKETMVVGKDMGGAVSQKTDGSGASTSGTVLTKDTKELGLHTMVLVSA